ncbi:hypothetical protein PPL_03330 [Heterostelium album PN500]|uniref:F-box domain-containing protein n=1 Tax=Heterostelium pallidum (strain ATCC 26659 / Pp 5 / PN500) TaxID=670386 RepID=D3B4K5_HETP5|nr:hypothetical protein PPL_03330 [Heterostelium album PN500]EFA84253.1 hypothetical protein PPL_03330 [Heterostelium album PN500]|eukprot:XP_020436369.1 hypothetical protein PPL_03330 [Heterostelium album PN500]
MLYYVLQHILKYLDNVDRICITLLCRQWYQDRSKYLLFDTNLLSAKNREFYEKDSTSFKLHSYRDQVFKSFQLKEEKGQLTISERESLGERSITTKHIIINTDNINHTSELPEDVDHWEFAKKFNSVLQRGQIREGVRRLTFGRNFNQTIESGVIPQSVEFIEFGYDFNRALDTVGLPHNLKTLVLGKSFNQLIKPGSLPSSLESLTFGESFNQPLQQGVLPAGLKYLSLGFSFNRNVEQTLSLFSNSPSPSSLETLKFGNHFNQPLADGVIPKSVKHLELGWNYNNEQLVIPDTVESIYINGSYFLESKRYLQFPKSAALTVNLFYHDFQIRKFNESTVLVLTESLEGGFLRASQIENIEKIYKSMVGVGLAAN